MGNRILKETILTSNEIDALSWFEEVVFYRLIVLVDDYGIYPADPVLLAHVLFPRKENVTRRMMEAALDHLEQTGLIIRYQVEGKGGFLCLTTWRQHQRLRNSYRKFPGPDKGTKAEAKTEEPEKSEAAKSEAEKTEPKEENGGAVPENAGAAPEECAGPPVITIPLNDGSEFQVLQKDADEYASLYPAVDVLQELRAMRGWCLSNTSRRKTRAGIQRFINSWLARAQDRGGSTVAAPGRPVRQDNPYQIMACEGAVI